MAQPQTPPTRRKSVAERVSPYYKAAKLVYKLMRAGGYIEFFAVTQDPYTRQPKYTSTHTVSLTDDELDHLDAGGKIVVAHACGYEAHVKL